MSYGSVPDAMIQNNPNSPAAADGLTLMPQAPRSIVDVGGCESEVTSETESLRQRDDDAMAGRAGACWMCVEKRWQLGLLGFTMEAVCYADRTNITLAILEMQKDLGWNEATAGIILSSFFAGYACTQVLGGWAAERWGAKPVLALAVSSWSAMTLITPACARMSLAALIACRVAMGLGEGLSLPAMHHATAVWIPVHERSRFVTLCTSGQFMGTVAAMAAGPLVEQSWASVFYLFGALGFVWLALWQWLAESRPEDHATIAKRELEYIRHHVQRVEPVTGRLPWLQFMQNRAFIGVVCAHFAHNWGWYLLLSWLPKYFSQKLGIKTGETGFLLVLPYLVPFATSNLSGSIADTLVLRGWAIGTVRKLMQTIAFVGPAASLAALASVSAALPRALAVALSCGALGFGAFSHSGYWANVVDLSPRYAGVLIGISNTIATLPGILANVSTGYILKQTGDDWTPVFMLAISIYALGLSAFLLLASGDEQTFR